jgi:hypothetical protein
MDQVKHYFIPEVKHWFIPRFVLRPDNSGMAKETPELDADELAKRLVAAMDGASPKVTSAAVALACNVTPQAVNGWRKNGRVHKKHLVAIASLTGRPLEYFVDPAYDATSDRAQSAELAARWLRLPSYLRPGVFSALKEAERVNEQQAQYRVGQSLTAPPPPVRQFPSGTRVRAKSLKKRRA